MHGLICVLVTLTLLHYFYVIHEERLYCLTINAEKELAIILQYFEM